MPHSRLGLHSLNGILARSKNESLFTHLLIDWDTLQVTAKVARLYIKLIAQGQRVIREVVPCVGLKNDAEWNLHKSNDFLHKGISHDLNSGSPRHFGLKNSTKILAFNSDENFSWISGLSWSFAFRFIHVSVT